MFSIQEKKAIYDLVLAEVETLALRIVNAPTKEIRTKHEQRRNKYIGICVKLEMELGIENYEFSDN